MLGEDCVGVRGRNRDALMKNQTAMGRNCALSSIVASSVSAAHAEAVEAFVRHNFGPDALAEAQRVGNGIRIRAALK